MDIIEECPDLNYFRVVAVDRGSRRVRVNYLVASLEESLGLKSLATMGHRDVREIVPMDKYNLTSAKEIEKEFITYGIYLAESSSYYNSRELERLKEDYFVSKIAGLKQGTL